MKAESWIFWSLAIFFAVVTPVYWLSAGELIGTTALLLALAFSLMLGAFMQIQANRIDPRAEDRKDAEIAEGAGELGFFPPSSIWPFWSAAAITVISLGPVFGWWLSLIGIGLGIWAVTGWTYQYYRGEFQH